MRRALVALAFLVWLAACGGGDADYFSEEELMNPENCQECHPTHYQEWSGSMHAYAGDDPVFLAMNARGQEETGGELGDFCVQCHAPMALRLGLTTDGLNLDEVPQYAKGVTCYFCHSAADVTDEHNNPIVLASDQVLRAGINNPVASPRHRAGYSSLVDADSQESSAMCGSCHDVTTPAGVHLEETFAEWQTTIFADPEPQKHLSCGQCHMPSRPGAVAENDDIDVPLRRVRDHRLASVDIALTDWPEKVAQAESIATFQGAAYLPRICVSPDMGGSIQLRLDNPISGHMLPTGAAHDRRVWVEMHAYDANDVELMATGVVADGEDPDRDDPQLWEIKEEVFDGSGQPTLFFWDVRSTDKTGLLRPTVTSNPNDPNYDHSTWRYYTNLPFYSQIRRVTMAVHVRPLAFAIVDALEASGHMPSAQAAQVRGALPTFTPLGSQLAWIPSLADLGGCVNPN